MIEDAELLRRYALHKSEEALGELVRRYINLVYATALRRVNGQRPMAEDVTQHVFTSLARQAGSLQRHPTVAGWLHVATRHAAASAVRSEQSRKIREHEAYVMNLLPSIPEPNADWNQLRAELDELIESLDWRARDAVVLRFFKDQKFSEIGAILRVSEDAARMRVERALEKLRALLARRGITSTNAALATVLTTQAAIAAPGGLAGTVTTAVLGHAVAGATSTSVIVHAYHFMSTTKILTGITSLIAVLAIGSAIYETRVAQVAETTRAALSDERATLIKTRDDLAARLKESDERLAQFQKAGNEVQAGNASATAAAPTTTIPADAASPSPRTAFGRHVAFGVPEVMLTKPETRSLVLEERALKMKARYERFFTEAGLSPEQRTDFLKAEMEAENQTMDFAAAYSDQIGVEESRTSIMKAKETAAQIEQEKETTLRSVLGDKTFQQYQRYSTTVPQRVVTDQLASRLYDTNAPLTAAQADQLAQILATNKYAQQSTPSPANSLDGTVITQSQFSTYRTLANQQNVDLLPLITDAALQNAQGVLSATQFTALKQLQAEQYIRLELAPALMHSPKNGN